MRNIGYRVQGTGYSKIQGFTLVELLVVISIIAMLMGILMPALGAARRSAYKTGCKQNLHGCGVAFRMYLDDNRNTMPYAMFYPSIPSQSEIDNNVKPISKVLEKYISGPEALKCPGDPQSKYWRENGSSYQYNTGLGGIRLDKKELTFNRRRHWSGSERTVTIPISEIEVMNDYAGFHGKKNSDGTYSLGAFMYLYADILVADRERNTK